MEYKEWVNKNYTLLKKMFLYSGYTNFEVYCEVIYNLK